MGTNTDAVLDIYAAFGRGDVADILDRLSDDIRWDEGLRPMQVPYLRAGSGKAHVLEFFQALSSTLEFTTFEPGAPCAAQDTVMVAVREAGRNLVTGLPLADDVTVHIWTFAPDGKVASFRHVGDFAIHEAAAGVGVSTTAPASR